MDQTRYALNTVYFREEIISCIDKATLRSLCQQMGIKVETADDRKVMAKKLAKRIGSATVNIEWNDYDGN